MPIESDSNESLFHQLSTSYTAIAAIYGTNLTCFINYSIPGLVWDTPHCPVGSETVSAALGKFTDKFILTE